MTSDNGKHTLVIDDGEVKDVGAYTVKFKEAESTANLTLKGMIDHLLM